MKLPFFFLFILVLTNFSLAQPAGEPSKAEPEWLSLYSEAQERAKTTGLPILMVFSGSDWCKPCMLLKRTLFESASFQAFAGNQLVLLELDFPARSKNKLSRDQMEHNESMAEKFNPEGAFPLALLLDSEEKVLGSFGYEKRFQPEDYLKKITYILNE